MLKTVQFALTVWLVLTLNFLLPRLMPGNPLADLDNPLGAPVPLSQEARARIMAYYGLDQPLPIQYQNYLRGLARGDLGWSIYYKAPVGHVLVGRLRWTLGLVGVATVLYVGLGVVLGAVSAWQRGSALDQGLLLTTFATGAFPAFFLAMLLIVLFAVKLKWLPLGGAQSVALLLAPWPQRTVDIARHMVLPVLALLLTSLADVYYLTRNSLGQVLGEGYITVARAKGLRERTLLFRHALPNALLPVVTLASLRLGTIVMGAMLVEVTFAYPGIGQAIYEASIARDYPLLQGAFLVTMLSIMAANLLADGLYGLLDPRVRRAP
ncbi:MAG TPA: ABC transporter permease [Anaerolineae bacterium]|nr:ABC transporter permease [Anaerolineae bacterium]